MYRFILLATIIAAAFACQQRNGQVCMDVYNKCPFPVAIGILGQTIPEQGGFKLNAGQSRDVYVPDGWTAGRFWARTGCDANYNCDTGFCRNSEHCSGAGGVPPVSLAEFTLNGAGGQDFYDVSLVDGYNIPVFIEPLPGTFQSNGGQFDCKRAGGCNKDVNQLCPPELRVVKNGRTVACKSACLAFNTDQYCCRGAYGTPDKCQASTYGRIFKDACPTAYSYAYDDRSSTFTCRGNNGHRSPNYRIQFC